MIIDSLILGAFETNSYVLRESDASEDCLVIDTGLEAGVLIDFLRDNELDPVAIVLTHGHVDHIGGLAALRSEFPDIKVYIHKLDAEMLTNPEVNLSGMTGVPFRTEPEDFALAEQDVVEQAGIRLVVLHTPGHTPGGICLYSKKEGVAFVGDTLFADSVGRTDFPNGSMPQLIAGIKEKLLTLPDDTRVYPGHGPITTIGHEKKYNQFLR
jgi:glyoxylase-like metal-dependent hydrolase (beta-lactamase superfamily II)